MINVEIKKYKNNQIICLQNEKTDKLFVLRSGSIKVYVNVEKKITEDIVTKTGKVVNIINTPNQTIGEIGLLLNRERSASLVAEGQVELEIITFAEGVNLNEIIKLNKEIGISILNTVIDRIIHTASQINSLKDKIDENLSGITKYTQKLFQMKIEGSGLNTQIQNLKKNMKSKYEMVRDNIQSVNRDYGTYKSAEIQENNVFEKKTIFFNKSNQDDSFYLLLSGKISILCNKLTVYTSDKKHTILTNFSMLLKEPKNENYFEFVCNEESKIKKIEKSTFHEMLEKEPVLYSYLSKILSLLLVNTDKTLLDLSKKNESLTQLIFKDADSLNKIFSIIKETSKDEEQKKCADEFFNEIKSA
ncbi:cyclic nucleotide-binding domain-containing protein [Candidatus Dependentiae bacterium]|nr:cyclic nucleotide-binding domain-containing protein [Candidatus Dependentiae bacterium]